MKIQEIDELIERHEAMANDRAQADAELRLMIEKDPAHKELWESLIRADEESARFAEMLKAAKARDGKPPENPAPGEEWVAYDVQS